MQIQYDSFSKSILRCCKFFGVTATYSDLLGIIGIGARFTLAMNVKTGKEIGHPSSTYCWDIISVVQKSFHAFGIDWKIYSSLGYVGARTTAAKLDRSVAENVMILDTSSEFLSIRGPVIFPSADGQWHFRSDGLEALENNLEQMPFGMIVIQISMITNHSTKFPYKAMNYIINTIERGEEPMEITGFGNYSAVSGWKAFARWMQTYSVPLRGVRHPYLDNLVDLLLERRFYYAKYWQNLVQNLDSKSEREFSERLGVCYDEVVVILTKIKSEGEDYSIVKQLYFTEQKTQPVLKELKNYMYNETRLGRIQL